MRKTSKRIALILTFVAMGSVQLHLSRTHLAHGAFDTHHQQAKFHNCDLCQTLANSQPITVPFFSPVLLVSEAAVVPSCNGFGTILSSLALSRGPPLA